MVSKYRIGVLIAGLIGVSQGQYLNTTTAIAAPLTPEGHGHQPTCEPKTVTITAPGGGYGSCPTKTVTEILISVSTTTCYERTTIE
ncbi:hypothetical protein EYC80_008191 [Monilinia laxa]|nr:hypothetical protein EYC80_008191 [Monilinia laxa]